MNREEAIKILSDYEENGCGFCHQGGDEVPQAFDMAIKSLEAWEKVIEDIKNISIYVRTTSEEMVMPYVNPNGVIHIIKKHLGEVEDEQTER